MIFYLEDTDVGVIKKENAEGGNNIRIKSLEIVWKRNIVRLGTRIVIIHIMSKSKYN